MHVTTENLFFTAPKAADDAASQAGIQRPFYNRYPKSLCSLWL